MQVPSIFSRLHTLRVAAFYSDTEVLFKFQFPTTNPSWYHGYKVFKNGKWVDAEEGDATKAPLASGLTEDRISIAIDDNKIADYAQFGGYIFAQKGTRSYPSAKSSDDVKGTFIEKRDLGSDVRKYLPETRESRGDTMWKDAKREEVIEQLKKDGVFLQTIQWRSHRSNPIGYADPGYVLEFRHSADGEAMYTSNWDSDKEQPLYMYDESKHGLASLKLEKLLERGYAQNEPYYLVKDEAKDFDPDHEWQEGDTLPATVLQEPEGARGAAKASGQYRQGQWHVDVWRPLEGHYEDAAKPIEKGKRYNLQFAIHTGSTGARLHLVTFPLTFSLTGDATLTATKVNDLTTAEEPSEWLELVAFYPGEILLDDIKGNETILAAYDNARQNPTDTATAAAFLEHILRNETSSK